MALFDDFNRANGPIGAGWETVLGTATPWIIESNAAEPGAAQQLSVTRRTEAAFPNNHYSQCQTEHTSDGVNDPSTGGVAVRIQANGDCYRARADNATATLSRVVGGASTFLSDFVIAPPIPDNTFATIRLTVAGSLLTVRVNGVDLGSFDDAGVNLINGGKPGMAQIVGATVLRARHENFESSDPLIDTLRRRRNMISPATTAIGINLTQITNSPNKSDIFPIHDASRLTLEVQADAPATAGSWVIKAVPAPDNSIDGQIVVTTGFPATPADVSSVTAEVAHMWGYVQQVTPIATSNLQRVIVYKQ